MPLPRHLSCWPGAPLRRRGRGTLLVCWCSRLENDRCWPITQVIMTVSPCDHVTGLAGRVRRNRHFERSACAAPHDQQLFPATPCRSSIAGPAGPSLARRRRGASWLAIHCSRSSSSSSNIIRFDADVLAGAASSPRHHFRSASGTFGGVINERMRQLSPRPPGAYRCQGPSLLCGCACAASLSNGSTNPRGITYSCLFWRNSFTSPVQRSRRYAMPIAVETIS